MRDDSTESSRYCDRKTVRRRPVLASLGALGTAGAVGIGAGTARTAAETTQDTDWETAAEERIQEHRTANLEVAVTDADGNELDGAEVEVTMQEHAYDFGTMIHAEFLTEGTEWGSPLEAPDGTPFDEDDQQRYRETVDELFNTVVLENLHKWNQWEDNQEIADNAVDWAVERGMNVRGHVCLWGNVDAWAIPADVVEAMGIEWEAGGATDPDHDPEYVVERANEHIEEIISHYGDDVAEWEVKNEVLHATAMIEAVEGEDVDPATAEILGDWYEKAEAVADEYDVDIAVNDYNALEGGYDDTQAEYERQIDYLVNERGVDLDGIGFQCHFANDETLEPDELLADLERYEGYGAGFRATEFDTFQGNWESPEEQGEYLRTFLKTWFSHPDTDSFLVWGHWDGVHWAPDFDGSDPDGVLFDLDWNPKPAHDYYTELVFDEWWTDETGETDGGVYETRAFKGEYEITVRYDGAETTTTATVSDGGETVELAIDGGSSSGDSSDDGDDDGSGGDEDGADGSEGADGDSVPGLGVATGLAGLSGLAGYALLRGDEEES
ncbi:endo-1,4-beta-xylanase [Halopiger xanaduensis]|uniref:endo-1,4-beta-xylanase n=1 Tax=Halopiger xanaduensis (strain DSM 18323 / JCM 14033 / SH-6) TaxID=797210 RepID=F8DCC2_HALXS|nr:endo-1,4-beta-xylanase [Halopiger xanaduensis]AEH38379.1 glycoside hydrolase family 10 [Halopiger xanaduensis SH-6]